MESQHLSTVYIILDCTIWPRHVLSLVPPISGQVTATCDQGHREEGDGGDGGGGGGVAAF